MNPTVSVIIPTYNTDAYIAQTIDSVLAQSYIDREILVVDDGSTDKTKEVLKPYMDVITYIYQDNRGRAGARNTAIKQAKGKYIALLDSDDLWPAGKLEKQVDIMHNNSGVDLLFGDKQRFADDGTIIISSMFKEKGYDTKFFGDPFYVRDPYEKLLQEPYIPTGTVIMKRECFTRSGLFDETIYAEDWEFWLRIALFNRLAYSSDLWELERDREGSGSKNLKAVYLSNIEALEKHEREYPKELAKLGINMNAVICEKYLNVGYFLLKDEKDLARTCFKKSLSRVLGLKTLLWWFRTFLPTYD